MERARLIWINGEFKPWEDATTHVLSHVVHYGTSVFEGVKCYETNRGPVVFRLRDHLARLLRSARIYRMPVDYDVEELERATLELIAENELGGCYLRPFVFRGYGDLGVIPEACPVQVAIAAFAWGAYLPSVPQGLRVKLSSVRRIDPSATPTEAKAGGHYLNSVLAKYEALDAGFDEALLMNAAGHVVEGTAQNVFAVRQGVLTTPPLEEGILPGITRDTVSWLARNAGMPVAERALLRADMLLADEAFLTGTATEVAPIGMVDGYAITCPGEMSVRLVNDFRGLLDGTIDPPDRSWFSPLGSAVA